ncbi:MAG: hypothetical protein AAF809_03265 [Bacteroidota bacterium]
MIPTATLPVAPCPLAGDAPTHLAALAEEARLHGSPSAFQATLATVHTAVRRLAAMADTARAAALSLAQHERLDALRAELAALDTALEATLDTTGRSLLEPDAAPAKRPRLWLWSRPAPSDAGPAASWSTSVADLLAALDAQLACLASLANGQPEGAPSRHLADDTATLLTRHRDALATEVRRWAA